MKRHIIYGCPECKEYLAKNADYKYCMYCGCKYDSDKLIVLVKLNREKDLLEEIKCTE